MHIKLHDFLSGIGTKDAALPGRLRSDGEVPVAVVDRAVQQSFRVAAVEVAALEPAP